MNEKLMAPENMKRDCRPVNMYSVTEKVSKRVGLDNATESELAAFLFNMANSVTAGQSRVEFLNIGFRKDGAFHEQKIERITKR